MTPPSLSPPAIAPRSGQGNAVVTLGISELYWELRAFSRSPLQITHTCCGGSFSTAQVPLCTLQKSGADRGDLGVFVLPFTEEHEALLEYCFMT